MSTQRQLGWYMVGIGSWYGGAGAQATLYPWLVAVPLAADASRMGVAQMVSMLPSLLLMLIGGAFADRHDGRKVLVALHALAAGPPLLLALAIANGHLSYGAILAYAAAMGSLSAFAIPARDSLLSRVAGSDLQRTVTIAILVQNVAQVVGVAVGGTAAALGAPKVLLFQALATLAGAAACWRLLPAPRIVSAASRGQVAEIAAGLRELVSVQRLFTVTLLSLSIGLLFLGPFLVAIPLMIRDLYQGSAPEIAGSNAAMMVGMLAGASGMLARGGVVHAGRALLLSLAVGAVMLLGVALGPPLLVVYALVFLFGVGGGVAMPSARTLVQQAAPESHRARVLSVYSLGFMGAAPIGAGVTGLVAESLGTPASLAIPAAVMLGVIVATLFASDAWLWRIRSLDGS